MSKFTSMLLWGYDFETYSKADLSYIIRGSTIDKERLNEYLHLNEEEYNALIEFKKTHKLERSETGSPSFVWYESIHGDSSILYAFGLKTYEMNYSGNVEWGHYIYMTRPFGYQFPHTLRIIEAWERDNADLGPKCAAKLS